MLRDNYDPELFHFQCKKISQIKLVNTLVKLDAYKINNYTD